MVWVNGELSSRVDKKPDIACRKIRDGCVGVVEMAMIKANDLGLF